ncbi:MAG TPA: hypothetical protein VKA32_06215, partial [Gammaproteobacteria bacterium]|nr:hypothetical protein [Gammaproteobacteria bacterium]
MLKKEIETVEDPDLDPAQMRSSVEGFSIEALPRDAKRIGDFREHLPAGTLVYVGWAPNTDIDEIVRAAAKLSRQGMTPVPHIAARRIPSERILWDLVGELVGDAGVRRLLMLGGDPNPPEGPYSDTFSILTSGVLQEFGVGEIGI